MIRRFVVPTALAAALGFTATAAVADGETVSKNTERHRVEFVDHSHVSRPAPTRVRYGFHHRHHHWHHVQRPWDGRYGLYPRRHFFVTGVDGFYGSPVNVATVTYRTYVYYTPTYPSLSYGYPPYAHLYDLTPGPIYNKPCLC
jgi:hypothetical protein